jgi:protein-tyrosine-phosphatase
MRSVLFVDDTPYQRGVIARIIFENMLKNARYSALITAKAAELDPMSINGFPPELVKVLRSKLGITIPENHSTLSKFEIRPTQFDLIVVLNEKLKKDILSDKTVSLSELAETPLSIPDSLTHGGKIEGYMHLVEGVFAAMKKAFHPILQHLGMEKDHNTFSAMSTFFLVQDR